MPRKTSTRKPIPTPPEIKTIRGLESQLASVRAELRLEKQIRGQAEAELQRSEHNLETVLGTKDKITCKHVEVPGKVSKGRATAILCVNDWHAESCVKRESVDGANEFNLQVADRRINRTWQKALWLLDFVRNISNVRELVVWLGGDLINGAIHEELQEQNFLGPTEAVLYVQDHIASGLDLLLRESRVDHITVVTSYGNHGRTTPKRRIATGYRHSWEWLSYSNLASYYRNRSKITFKVEQGYHNWLDVQGHPIRFHHGDAIRYAGGVGGVTIPLRKKIAQWNKRRHAYLDIIGHFHQFIDAWDYVVCGCLVGYDAYALEIGAEFQRPTQTFIVIDRNYGKVVSLPVFCE